MSGDTVCGAIKKKSQLGISWNPRYLAIVDNHVNIYKNEQEYKKKNGKCKYSFNDSAKMTKLIENKKEVGIQISTDNKHKYKFLIPHSLWKLLHKYYTNIRNAENESENIIVNEEQKTQDTQDTDTATKLNITESNEILPNINNTLTKQPEKKQQQQQTEEEEPEELQLTFEETPDINQEPQKQASEEQPEPEQEQEPPSILEESPEKHQEEPEQNQEENQEPDQKAQPEENREPANEENQDQKAQPEEDNLNENAINILTHLITHFDVCHDHEINKDENAIDVLSYLITHFDAFDEINKDEEQNGFDSETEETENKPDIKYEWNKKYKNALDLNGDEAVRIDAVSAIVSEFCCMCKMQCIDLIENGNLCELNNAFISIRDEIEFKIIKNDNECQKIKLLIANSKQYVNAFDAETEKLYCPLSCIVEYMNYRIYCKACLPLISENLIFGKNVSDDTFKFDAEISKLLDNAAKTLNLSAHSCKYNGDIQISTTSNITIYETENGVFHIDNISELYPVDTVHFVKNFVKNGRNKESTARLHPKLVELNSDSISSDSFISPNDDKNDEIASKAIYKLHSSIIPKFAENINNLKIKFLDCNELEALTFERGIDMIYIGEIYNLCKVRYAKEIMAVLMIAQIIKKEINNQPITSNEQFEEKMKYYINCFTTNDDSYKIESDFKHRIISLTNAKYRICLTADNVNNVSFKFAENEFERIFNANKQEDKYVFDTKICLSVPDKYTQNGCHCPHNSDLKAIQKDWLKLQDSKYKFEEFRKLCELLMNRIDEIFAFHVIKFDIMGKMIEVYLNENVDNIDTDYCCSLYSDYFNLSALSFGSKHRQTLSIQIQLAKLLHSKGEYRECVHKLEDLLAAIQSVFGKNCLNAVIVLKMLCDTYFDQGNYEKSMHFAKQSIVILDEKKRFKNAEYISAHLKISLIAEKMDDQPLGMRFLNKLYNYLKKQTEKENKQKLWENIDIKILCLLITRIKLKMCNKRKLNDLLAKWKSFYQEKHDCNDCSMQQYNKQKELIIQNLCLNPIQKSNDLLKRNAETIQVICWINIIKEFESLFLGIN